MTMAHLPTGSSAVEYKIVKELGSIHVLQTRVGDNLYKGPLHLTIPAFQACDLCVDLSAVFWGIIAKTSDKRYQLKLLCKVSYLLRFVCDVQIKQSQAGECWLKGVLVAGFGPKIGTVTELRRMTMQGLLEK